MTNWQLKKHSLIGNNVGVIREDCNLTDIEDQNEDRGCMPDQDQDQVGPKSVFVIRRKFWSRSLMLICEYMHDHVDCVTVSGNPCY